MRRELIAQATEGDEDAFAELIAPLISALYTTARLILRADDAAHDAVQDALIRAWKGIRGLREPDRFEAWVRRLLIRSCYDAAKRERSRRSVEVRWVGMASTVATDDYRTLAMREELAHAFARLPPDQRAVLVVRHYLDLSDADAAEALSIPVGTMKSRLNRATSAMRAAIEAEERQAAHAEERLA
jgi:RNA polymerase sigma-70 factor, ECF subfamily